MTKRAPTPSRVGPELAKFAEALLKQAQEQDPSGRYVIDFKDRLETFKLVTAYHVGVTKSGADEGDRANKNGAMNGFKSRIAEAGAGTGNSRTDAN